MKKALLACAVILLAAGTLFAGGRGQRYDGMTIAPGILQVGMDINYPPFCYFDVDGVTPRGFDVELSRAIASRLGLEVRFIDTAWTGIFAAVDTGRFDAIISAVTVTPARLAAHNFSRPYLANPIVMVVNRHADIDAGHPMDAAGLDVGFQADTTADHFMMGLVANEGLQFAERRYESVMHAFEDLRLGRLDVVMVDYSVAGAYLAEPDSPFEVVWMNPEMEFFGIAMRIGNDALTDAINGALEELFADGTLVELSYRILGVDMITAAFDR